MSGTKTSWRELESKSTGGVGPALSRAVGEQARRVSEASGAIGVGYAPKRVAGRGTDEASVVFLVESKQRPRGEPIPRELDGLATDVLEVGAVRRLEPRRDAFSAYVARPLPWGVGIGAVESGTLGALVTRQGDDKHRYVLSNNHVIANFGAARVGDRIYQPSSLPDEEEDWFATLTKFVPLLGLASPGAGGATPVNRVDAAIARVRTPWKRYVSERHAPSDYAGRIWSWRKTRDIPVGLPVAHVGATTGAQSGEVLAFIEQLDLDLGPPIGRARFVEQLVIRASGMGGDSGSLAYCPSDGSAIGLLFATSEVRALRQDGVDVSAGAPRDPVVIASPIQAVQRALGVRVAPAAWKPPGGLTRAEYQAAAAAARDLDRALGAQGADARVRVDVRSSGAVLVVEGAAGLDVPRTYQQLRVVRR